MLFAQFSAEFDCFEKIWFIRRGQFVADVVAEDLAIPVFLRRWFPWDFESVLVNYFNFDSARGASRCYKMDQFGRYNKNVDEDLKFTSIPSSAVMMVTVSEGSEDPTSFSATSRKW